jgi:glycosyltransferase involved in cell wall biosynthesis
MMITIAFVYPRNSYLPDIKAYTDYFIKKGFNVITIPDEKASGKQEYDIEWHIMGVDTIKSAKNVIKIHDFASLSTSPFARSKDFFKKFISPRPHIRIFLNEKVRESMNFKDSVPFCYRDMGVNSIFLDSYDTRVPKEFDFCYLGNMQKLRQVDKFLVHFKDRLKSSNILMIGKPPDYLSEMFKNDSNIIFTGDIEYLKVPALLKKCIYGINYVPDYYPFNIQTSTKMLEYCACGLKIISNEYEWVKKFEKKEGGSFFYLQENFENFTLDNIGRHSYSTPAIKNYEWDMVIENSGILELINSLVPQITANTM